VDHVVDRDDPIHKYTLHMWVLIPLSQTPVLIFHAALIAYRIVQGQRVIRALSQSANDRLSRTLVIILESAAIYSSALVVLITCYVVKTNAQYTILDIVRTSKLLGSTGVLIIS
jgi:hypothetical protein